MVILIIAIVFIVVVSGVIGGSMMSSASNVTDRSGGTSIVESVEFNSADYMIVSNAKDFQSYIKGKNHYQAANDSWSDACLGFSLAYCDAIYTKNFNVGENVVNNNPQGLVHYGYSGRKIFSSKDEMLKTAYNELSNNKPVVIHVNGNTSGTSRHYVAAVRL